MATAKTAKLARYETRGDKWLLRCSGLSDAIALKLTGCFDQRINAPQSKKCAVVGYERPSDGTFLFLWREVCGYKSAYAWCNSACKSVQPRSRKQNFTWNVDAGGTSPPGAGGAAPRGGAPAQANIAAQDAATQVCAEQPPAKLRCRMSRKQSIANMVAGDSPQAGGVAVGGASPQPLVPKVLGDPDWLLQKALKIAHGVILDDPACTTYRIVGGKMIYTTLHSVTYLVDPPKADQAVVKVVKNTGINQACNLTFLAEVDFLSKLRHRNIVALLDVIQADNMGALVLEFGGRDLNKLIQECAGASPFPGIEQVLDQLLSAVGHVHAHLVVHSDLKPGNMVIDAQGVLRLIDFGLSFTDLPSHRRKRSQKDLGNHGIAYGTMRYRAIEVCLGDKSFGQPMDIWAIGCIVFELVTCVPLFSEPKQNAEMVQHCFQLLGQHDKTACLDSLPRWRPWLKCTLRPVDFWSRIRCVAGPGVEAYARLAYAMLNFDQSDRPDIHGCFDLWAAARHQLKESATSS